MEGSSATAPRVSRWAGVPRTVGLDVVAPLLVLQPAVAAGVPVVRSLVLPGCPPLIGVVVDWLRWRSIEVVGVVVCGGIALAVVLAVLTRDPRMVLLEGVVVTFVFGLVCVASLRAERPLIFHFARAFHGLLVNRLVPWVVYVRLLAGPSGGAAASAARATRRSTRRTPAEPGCPCSPGPAW